MPTVVTSALPYANGPIHLGHLVEYIQTDIFCRFLRLTGEDVIYVCADDTHGAPIELKARELGVPPEKLVEKVYAEHTRDFSAFGISFDIFYNTHSPENKGQAEFIYQKLREHGTIVKKTVPGMFCEHDGRFLPDRYVRGTCPRCKAPAQYGDSCEACGATYEPADLADPQCSLCGRPPVRKNSEHLFFQLDRCADFLRDWVDHSGALGADTANFVRTWLSEGLRDWCISRDGPYFGFSIPGEPGKYFYVWLDAPIGYISSTEKYCKDHGRDFASYWRKPEGTVYHFIGKDIVYFHTLFWPAMLHLAGYNLPKRVFVHGFLTVNGQKMSKSRGTFVTAEHYLHTLNTPDASSCLRYYYAGKLGPRPEDIDLNVEDFHLRVNAGLVNNIGNLHNRCFTFCERQFNGKLGKIPQGHPLLALAEKTVRETENHFRNLEFGRAMEKIHQLGDAGNKFFQDAAPWSTVKTDPEKARTDITLCVNVVKILAVLLKPVVPVIAGKIEQQLGGKSLQWADAKADLEDIVLGKTEKIIAPVDAEAARRIVAAPAPPSAAANPEKARISIEEFGQTDLRVATVLSAEPVPKADRLLKLRVSLGAEERELVAGIAEHYKPEDLINTQVVMVANLQPAVIRGIASHGMILAAKDGKKLTLVRPEKPAAPGSRVA